MNLMRGSTGYYECRIQGTVTWATAMNHGHKFTATSQVWLVDHDGIVWSTFATLECPSFSASRAAAWGGIGRARRRATGFVKYLAVLLPPLAPRYRRWRLSASRRSGPDPSSDTPTGATWLWICGSRRLVQVVVVDFNRLSCSTASWRWSVHVDHAWEG